jgi:hypothetical protein
MGRPSSDRDNFRWSLRIFALVLFGFAVSFAVDTWRQPETPRGAALLITVLVALMGAFYWRVLRMRVVIGAETVEIRHFITTDRLAREDVVGFAVRSRRIADYLKIDRLIVTLRDGRWIGATYWWMEQEGSTASRLGRHLVGSLEGRAARMNQQLEDR